jgi:hypothetical protein
MLFLHQLLFFLLGTSVLALLHPDPLALQEHDELDPGPEPGPAMAEPLRFIRIAARLSTGVIGRKQRLGIW